MKASDVMVTDVITLRAAVEIIPGVRAVNDNVLVRPVGAGV
jgi:hypothetical protein